MFVLITAQQLTASKNQKMRTSAVQSVQSTPFIADTVGTSSQCPHQRVSVIAGVDFSQTSVICFCWGFSCCPYYRGVRYSGVSARRELTVHLILELGINDTLFRQGTCNYSQTLIITVKDCRYAAYFPVSRTNKIKIATCQKSACLSNFMVSRILVKL